MLEPTQHWTIVGAGRAGLTLAVALAQRGVRVDLVTRRADRQVRVQAWLEPLQLPITVQLTVPPADRVVLAVPDGAIAYAAAQLPVVSGAVWLHLSGAQPWTLLHRDGGAMELGAMHPLAALPDPLTVPASLEVGRPLMGATCAISGTQTAQAHAVGLANLIGGIAVTVHEHARSLYHAAAAVAANDLVGLLAVATEAAVAAGLSPEQARLGLTHLMQTALDAVTRLPPTAPLAQGLTGAVSRGDAGTLAKHLAALRPLSPGAVVIHAELSRTLVAEVRAAGLLSDGVLARMDAVLVADQDAPT